MAEKQSTKKSSTEPGAETTEDTDIPEGQMRIKVYSPFRNYYDDLASSITAVNLTGPFDILPGHHKFLTLLSSCEIDIRRADSSGEKIKIDKGIMYVKKDRVTVFLDV